MNDRNNILANINKNYFWDIDQSRLDADRSKRIIIERVFSLGTSIEISAVRKHYSDSVIKKTLTNLNYLDKKTLNYASKLYNIPLHSFKCYTQPQSKETR